MAAEFWAGYLSGVAATLLGNPLDIVKVRLQSASVSSRSSFSFQSAKSYLAGLPAPLLTYGALNGLLFWSYHQSLSLLPHQQKPGHDAQYHPAAHFLAGAAAGAAVFVVSAPTEYVKCRAQLADSSGIHLSSWAVTKQTLRHDGLLGLYRGGLITSLRDSIGFGFYYLAYELSKSAWDRYLPHQSEHLKILACGGAAGVATWTSVFPLDAIKTRVQTQSLSSYDALPPKGAWVTAKHMYRQEGSRAFWRGLGVCNLRAAIVNAAQFYVYEWCIKAFSASSPAI